jgi:hypothetical protein
MHLNEMQQSMVEQSPNKTNSIHYESASGLSENVPLDSVGHGQLTRHYEHRPRNVMILSSCSE